MAEQAEATAAPPEAGAEPGGQAEPGAGGAGAGEGADQYAPIIEHLDARDEKWDERFSALEEAVGGAAPGADPAEGAYAQPPPMMGSFDPTTGQFTPFGGQPAAPMDPRVAGMQQLVDPATGMIDPNAAQSFIQQMEAGNQQALQKALEPLTGQLGELQVSIGMGELQEEFPELGTDEAKPVWERAGSLAQEMGNPDLVLNPNFIRTVYLAQKAQERAAGEEPAGAEREVELEAGGGAPLGAEGDDQPGKRIVAAGQSQNTFPFQGGGG